MRPALMVDAGWRTARKPSNSDCMYGRMRASCRMHSRGGRRRHRASCLYELGSMYVVQWYVTRVIRSYR